MIKSVRNNWLNLKSKDKVFNFSPFLSNSFGTSASFKQLEDLYNDEKKEIVKIGFKLNSSAISPTSIQRQKVSLALKIFHETTVSALRFKYPDNTSTSNFLEAFQHFWKIFNVNTLTKVCIQMTLGLSHLNPLLTQGLHF